MENVNKEKSLRQAWAEVDLGALATNIDLVKSRIEKSGSLICGVLKANAYGCGLEQCHHVMRKKGISCFAVATLEEALLIRRWDSESRIFIMGPVADENAEEVVKYNLLTLYTDFAYVQVLSAEAVRQGKTVEILTPVDTGMGRLGLQAEDPALIEEIKKIAKLPGIKFAGIMSHFSCENFEDKSWSLVQLDRFNLVYDKLQKEGIEALLCNISASGSGYRRENARYGMCRCGGLFYGRYQNLSDKVPGLRPVLSVKCKVTYVKEVPADFSVSYGRSGRTQRPSVIATLPLGYCDGVRRAWGCGTGYVLIHGQKAPTIGVVCMDQMMVDVTGIPGVKRGDEVVIVGSQGGQSITVEDMAAALGTNGNEIACGFSIRLPFVYKGESEI